MSTSDYDIHLDRMQYDSLWDGDETDSPFHEDLEEIERAIAETLGTPKRRRKPKRLSK